MSDYPWGERNEALPEQVAAALAAPCAPLVLDVRTSPEYEDRHIPGALSVPMDALVSQVSALDRDAVYVVVCEHSVRSRACTAFLLQRGLKVVNMVGGMASYPGPTESGPPA